MTGQESRRGTRVAAAVMGTAGAIVATSTAASAFTSMMPSAGAPALRGGTSTSGGMTIAAGPQLSSRAPSSGTAAPAAVGLAVAAAALATSAAAASRSKRSGKRGSRSVACRAENPTATFNTTMGEFKAEIYLDRVPITASNFIDLCSSGFYNGVHFHRVIPGFMNQFGCPNAKDPNSRMAGTGGPPDGEFKNLETGAMEKRSNGGNIQDENISRDSNEPGTLSMANTGRPNSGGSQFFINVANNNNLDWFSPGPSKHPVFGKVLSGYDVVKKISEVRTRQDNPVDPIKMNFILVEMSD